MAYETTTSFLAENPKRLGPASLWGDFRPPSTSSCRRGHNVCIDPPCSPLQAHIYLHVETSNKSGLQHCHRSCFRAAEIHKEYVSCLCLQCGIRPAVLPPIWQLLEKEAPDPRQPRVLQLPNINSAALKRVLNQAATGGCGSFFRFEGASCCLSNFLRRSGTAPYQCRRILGRWQAIHAAVRLAGCLVNHQNQQEGVD